ncbi:hypothetical protein [Amycolatopsis minnesotensis]|uniref:DUF4239 domain-containing protein n=1 Tax=Amycolatopsis minnesotensis TaxID=337894 RepID=A0ABN2QP64_9PSEU
MSIYLSGLLWVVGAAAAGAGSAYLVRRFGLDEGRPDNNDAAGQVFTIVSGLQAVIVAFVLISQFDAVDAARDGAFKEANAAVAASWAADALPEPTRGEVREQASAYARTVQDVEWPQMRDGKTVDSEGWAQLDRLRDTVAGAEIPDGDDWATDRKTESANQLWEVYQARQERITGAAQSGLGVVLWFVLILGSVVTTLLPNLFGGTRPITHIIIVSTLAGTITLLLFAIYQLQNPYAGGTKIEPDAFHWALDRLR